MLIILFSISLDLVPGLGLRAATAERCTTSSLPCLTVALALSAVLTRSLRASMLMELESDYVTAARARGLSENRHLLASCDAQLAHPDRQPARGQHRLADRRVGGGRERVRHSRHGPASGPKAIFSRDYMVVQACRLVFAVATVLVNLRRGYRDRGDRPAGKAMTAQADTMRRRRCCGSCRAIHPGDG
jgi:peptide/nickel transport system permease protein